jgi:hypothetical protein
MNDQEKQRTKSDLESKKRNLEMRRSGNQNQLGQLDQKLKGGKPLDSFEEMNRNRLEKENDEYDKQVKEIEKAISQL